jgi:hypothetical protein
MEHLERVSEGRMNCSSYFVDCRACALYNPPAFYPGPHCGARPKARALEPRAHKTGMR